jgi:hypothetical protein
VLVKKFNSREENFLQESAVKFDLIFGRKCKIVSMHIKGSSENVILLIKLIERMIMPISIKRPSNVAEKRWCDWVRKTLRRDSSWDFRGERRGRKINVNCDNWIYFCAVLSQVFVSFWSIFEIIWKISQPKKIIIQEKIFHFKRKWVIANYEELSINCNT